MRCRLQSSRVSIDLTSSPTCFLSLAIPILLSFSEWVIASYYAAQGLSLPPPLVEEDDEDEQMEPAQRKVGEEDPLLGVVFSIEAVREICQEVLKSGGEHLAEVRFQFGLTPLETLTSNLSFVRARNCGTSGEILRLIS